MNHIELLVELPRFEQKALPSWPSLASTCDQTQGFGPEKRGRAGCDGGIAGNGVGT